MKQTTGEKMTTKCRKSMWMLTWALLLCLCGSMVQAAAPSDWKQENVPVYPYPMTIMARVHQNGSALKVPDSMIAVFYGTELRAVAKYDDSDGLFFYNLTVMCAATTESGYTFKYYDPITDKVYDLTLPSGYDPLVYKQAEYGGFPPPNYNFEPFVLVFPDPLPTVTVTATDATATEPASSTATATDTGVFRFTRTGSTTAALTVYYSVSGTATSGTDYASIGTSVTIPAGSSYKDVAVTPKYDTASDNGETVVVTLTSKTTYGIGTQKTATVTVKDPPVPDRHYHPADSMTKDYKISGLEYLKYAGPVKTAALGSYEYEWDGTDIFSMQKKTRIDTTTRAGGVSITRSVTPATYAENTQVTVTMTMIGVANATMLFISEIIPEGWTVIGDEASSVANGKLNKTWDAPDIPSSYVYILQAPAGNLADTYIITSSSSDTGCFINNQVESISVSNTELKKRTYHPADSITKDYKISGLEYLKYAGPVKTAALGNYEYDWDGVDFFVLPKAGNTRGIVTRDENVAIIRSVEPSIYTAGSQIAVTLTMIGVDDATMLFISEFIPEEWTVIGDEASSVADGKLSKTWDAPNIPSSYTYILEAPVENLAASYELISSSEDTGCFINNGLLPITVENTIITNGDIPLPVTYTVTVENGTSDGQTKLTSSEGDTITITADAAPNGMVFDKWTSEDGVEFADASAAETSFTMLAKDVTVTATYAPIPVVTYTVTVVNGMSDGKTELVASEGDTIAITADAAAEGMVFEKWTSEDGVEFADASAAETSFTMLAKDVTVTATYAPVPVVTYTVTIVNGMSDGKTELAASEGDTIAITADAAAEGMVFEKWTSEDGVEFADASVAETSFTMLAKDVTVTATYAPVPVVTYTVAVVNGTVNGKVEIIASEGDTITVKADAAPAGMAFAKWEAEGVELKDATTTEVSFKMPSNAVTLTATFAQAAQLSIVRSVEPSTYTSGSQVMVTLTMTGIENAAMLFISEYIPEGWTVVGNDASSVADGKLSKTWDAPNIPYTYNYVLQAPDENLAASYELISSSDDTGCFMNNELLPIAVENTLLTGDIPVNYTVTIINGTSDGKTEVTAYAGDTITIVANAPAEHELFDKWAGDVEFANATASTTSFTMPANDVTVTATYKPEPQYTVTIINGTSDGKTEVTAYVGETIAVTYEPVENAVFDQWTSEDGVDFADAKAQQTTFTMPAKNVTVTATYKPVYTVTVVNGTTSGKTEITAFENDTVPITANTPADGKLFKAWTGDVEFADAMAATTSFTMPAKDVTVTATYKTLYTITLEIGENGVVEDAGNWTVEGTTLTYEFYDSLDEDLPLPVITANEGFKFLRWNENGIKFENQEKIAAGWNRNLTLTAKYYDGNGYEEWPEDMELYEPADGKIFRESRDLAVTFNWPAILNAEGYRLVIATYGGNVVFDEAVEDTTCTVNGLKLGSFVWNVTAIGDECEAGTSQDFHFAVVEDNGIPVIKDANANGTTIELTYDTEEKDYRDGVFAYQMFFYSLTTNKWTSLTQNLQVANGKAVVNLGVNVSNGYLYICPITIPESNFIELYIK